MSDEVEMGLPDYGGKQVLRTKVSIRNAGDGLSEGLQVEPILYEIGTRLTVVLDVEVVKHNHGPLRGKDTDYLEVEQVLRASTAVVTEATGIRKALDRQRAKIDRAREAAAGVERLPGVDDPEPDDVDPDDPSTAADNAEAW